MFRSLFLVFTAVGCLTTLASQGRAMKVEQISPSVDLAEAGPVLQQGKSWLVPKAFHQFWIEAGPVILSLQIEVEDGEGQIAIDEAITNNTDQTWDKYSVALLNYSGTAANAEARFDPNSVASSTLTSVQADDSRFQLSGGTVLRGEDLDVSFTITTNGIPGTVFVLKQWVSSAFVDCNGNRIADDEDVASGDSGDCNGNGMPDECEEDGDDDGVIDDCDACPNSETCATVDQTGCPIDSDNDGVVDGCDACPNTPSCALAVDANGCGVDSDGDGTIDGCEEAAQYAAPQACCGATGPPGLLLLFAGMLVMTRTGRHGREFVAKS